VYEIKLLLHSAKRGNTQIRLPVFSASASALEANGQFHAAIAFIPRKCAVKTHWKHAEQFP